MESVSPLIDFDEARRHLRVVLRGTASDGDVVVDIQNKLDVATRMVIHRINDPAVTSLYTEGTLPAEVFGAILLQLEDLYTFRGGNVERSDVAPGVDALLGGIRKPSFA